LIYKKLPLQTGLNDFSVELNQDKRGSHKELISTT
jgi:hypothetical protein